MSSKTTINTEPIVIDSGKEDQVPTLDQAPKSNEGSRNNEHPAPSSKDKQNLKINKPTASKHSDLVALCPLSTTDVPCNRCKVEKVGGDKVFHCHCGVKAKTLRQGQTEKAINHWKTGLFFLLYKTLIQ